MSTADPSIDYYKVLELTPSATAAEIKKQYQKLALKYHPDHNRDREAEATREFQEVSAAYGILYDPAERKSYDLKRQLARDREQSTPLRTYQASPRAYPNPNQYYAQQRSAPSPVPPPRPAYNAGPPPNTRPSPMYAGAYPNGNPVGATSESTGSKERYEAWERMRQGGGSQGHSTSTPKPQPARASATEYYKVSSDSGPFGHSAGFNRSGKTSSGSGKPGRRKASTSGGDEPQAPTATSSYYTTPRSSSYATGSAERSASTRGPQRTSNHIPTGTSEPLKSHRRSASTTRSRAQFSNGTPTDASRQPRVESERSGDEYEPYQRPPQHHSSATYEPEFPNSSRHKPRMAARSTEPYDRGNQPNPPQNRPPPKLERPNTFTMGDTSNDQYGRPASASGHRFSFQARDDTFAQTPTAGAELRSKSTENISGRLFSPNEWSDKFVDVLRFPPPINNTTRRDHRPRSPRRSQNRPSASQRGAVPPIPANVFMSASAPTNPLKDPPSTLKPTGFSQEAWTDSINRNDFQDPPLSSKRSNPRMKSGRSSGAPSRVSKATSLGATVGSDEETSAYDRSGSKSAESSSSRSSGFSAMEIDPPTPVQEKERSQGLPPRPAYVPNFDDGRAPPVNASAKQESKPTHRSSRRSSATTAPPSTKPLGQESPTQAPPTKRSPPRAATSLGHSFSTEQPNIDLKDLGNVEPLASTNGLEQMGSMASSLPFQSRPSSTTSLPYRDLQLPMPPRAPEVPSRHCIAETWKEYSTSMDAYVKEWLKFDNQMLAHFESRKAQIDGFPASWLLSAGEPLKGGFLAYMQGLKQDERARAHWTVAWEKHYGAMQAFEKVRNSVLELMT